MTETENTELAIPPVNVLVNNQPISNQQIAEESIITDSELKNIYMEVMTDLRSNTSEIDIILNNFVEMVMNDGDSSSSTKEAVVNLIKIKTDIADKKTKIASLMTDLKLKEKITSKVQSNQTNHIHIKTDKRSILETLNRIKKGKNEPQLDEPK